MRVDHTVLKQELRKSLTVGQCEPWRAGEVEAGHWEDERTGDDRESEGSHPDSPQSGGRLSLLLQILRSLVDNTASTKY